MNAASSRLVRKEKSRLVKQTLLIGGLAIVLGIVFIFVILPLFIVILNKIINTDPFPETEKIELQVPLLNAPVTATNSAQLQLTGYAQPGTEVVLLLNAKESTTARTGDDGAFLLTFNLDTGENVLSVFSRDEAENVSANSQDYIITLDSEPPKVVIDEPQPETHFDRKSRVITIRGLTDPQAKVYINDRLVLAGTDGAFTTTVSLQDNKNELKIVVIDTAGNRTEQMIPVYLDP